MILRCTRFRRRQTPEESTHACWPQKVARAREGEHTHYYTTTPSHLHAACDKEKPSGTCTTTTEWTVLPAVLRACCAFDVAAAGTDAYASVLLQVAGTPEPLLSFRRRLLAGAAADMTGPFDSEDTARRLEARVDISVPLALQMPEVPPCKIGAPVQKIRGRSCKLSVGVGCKVVAL